MNSMMTSDQSKRQELLDFLNKRTVKCVQGDQQWHDMRCGSFGGSEIANLMGQHQNNKYMPKQFEFLSDKKEAKRQGISASKLKKIKQDQQIMMDWGTFFEPLHRDVMSNIFQSEIIEASLAHGQGHMQGCHQSPDGVSVIDTDILLKHIKINKGEWKDLSIFQQKNLCVLFEQKCPARRAPNGLIPSHYIGQVKLGLEIFSVCEMGIFSDSLFKLCSFNQMFNTAHNKRIIYKKNDFNKEQPIYVGIVMLDDEWLSSHPNQQIRNLSNMGDISSTLDMDLFMLLTQAIKESNCSGRQVTSNIIMKYEDAVSNISELKKKITSKSYICCKLLDITFVPIEKSKAFGLLISIFVNLGQRFIDSASLQDQNLIKQFTEIVSQLEFPISADDQQDLWLSKNKREIIKFLEQNHNDSLASLKLIIEMLMFESDVYDKKRLSEYLHHIKGLSYDKQEQCSDMIYRTSQVLQENHIQNTNDEQPALTSDCQTCNLTATQAHDSEVNLEMIQSPASNPQQSTSGSLL